ncbi:S46 family peptidase [Gemmata sp. JC673]|uniref:Dipeptidyl-peptidase n=1 Tax=Gemmata algarum TaxID=2975278 RepID=A0ABU5F4Z2_9BACT|nr:S46 family peptidase [Gemmata algarum]MDY3561298.1 S46 family peptidase [Gemmata algarum]
MAHSDEGMWLLNDPPRQLLKERHQFDLTDPWLKNAMLASVRLNSGGSGGFVSPDGLFVTNHHVAADSLQKLSTAGKDLLRDGFYADARDKELKCPDQEINVLQDITDVTKEVNAAVKPDMTAAEAFAARRAVMGRIEKESLDKTGLRSDVVTLYNGGLYHLYRYKKYTDVRLVFAPEKQIASFGGDVDNFEYPRMNLDVTFFRAYENGQPAKTPHFLKWSQTGPQSGELVFVTGHPGTTQRLETLARLKHRRDELLPYTLYRLRTLEAALKQYGEQSPECARQAATDLHSVANARKAFSGQLQGLLDPKIMEQKQRAERDLLRAAADARGLSEQTHYPKLRSAFDDAMSALERIEAVQAKLRGFEKAHALVETGHAFFSPLFGIARHCVRMGDELPKKSADRLREYRDSNLESLKYQLFSPAPLYPELERAKLAASLTFLAENLGGEHDLVKLALAGKNPAARAEELTAGTKLFAPAERKRLVEGGAQAVAESKDPLIQLARAIDAEARKLRARYENEVEEPERQAYAALAAVRFLAYGSTVAPDATFTLRLAFGTVQGYEVGGEKLNFHTTFGEAFEKSAKLGGAEPFDLPKRWLDGKDTLDLKTPFNFVSTADTIGGNSGSPVLNRAGELVGINFDRNRHGLVRNFVYTDVQARHIAVHSKAVLEALRKLYPAAPLVKELVGQ